MTSAREKSRYSFRIILTTAALMLMGVACIPLLSIQYSPTPRGSSLTVVATYQASARVVEACVAQVIEGAMNALPGVSDISTRSSQGYCTVTMTFKDGTDMQTVRFDVSTRLRQIQGRLPDGCACYLSGSARTGASGAVTILSYTVNADAPAADIVQYATRHFVPRLARIDGVDRVATSGAAPYEWVVAYSPLALQTVMLAPENLAGSMQGYGSSRIVGTRWQHEGPVLVRLRLKDPENGLESIPIGLSGDRLLSIANVAKVSCREQTPNSYRRTNGLNTVELYVDACDGVNTLKVASAVKECMAGLQRQLPQGYHVSLNYDASQSLSREIRRILTRAALSMAILLLLTLLVSRSLRYLTVIGLTVMADVLISLLFYKLLGIDLEMYSMAGITVSMGIVMDTAIVVADHYSRYGNCRVMLPVLGALLTTVAALMLVFFLPGDVRRNLDGFIWVTVISLTMSIVTGFVLVPALMGRLLPVGQGMVKGNVAHLRRTVLWSARYTDLCAWLRRHRVGFAAAIAVLTAASYMLYRSAGIHTMTERNETKPEPVLTINASLPHGSNVRRLDMVMRNIEDYLKQLPEVSVFHTDISGTSASIDIHFKEEYHDTGFPIRLKQELWRKALNYGGITWDIPSMSDGDRQLTNGLQRTSWPHTVRLYGYDCDMLYRYAAILVDSLKAKRRVPDAGLAQNLNSMAGSELFIKYDRENIARTGLDVARYHSYLSGQLTDSYVTSLPGPGPGAGGGGMAAVRLVSADAIHSDLWHMENTIVQIDSTLTRLTGMGTADRRASGTDIERHNQEYVVNVGYDYVGSPEMRLEMELELMERLNGSLPIGFRAQSAYNTYGYGDRNSKAVLVICVILAVFMICAALFESPSHAFAIIMLVPVSLAGMFTACALFHIPSGQGTFAAIIMLCGLTVNAGIYLTAQYRTVLQYADGCNLTSNVCRLRLYVKAYNEKIVPTMLTVVSTVLGLVPFLLDGRTDMFWFSFAVCVTGGMLFSVVALVLVMPVFFPFGVKFQS